MERQRYRELFLEESREHLRAAERAREALAQDPSDRGSWRELLRHAHSLKGMAASLDLREMVRLAHGLEDRLSEIDQAPKTEIESALSAVAHDFSALGEIVQSFACGELSLEPEPQRDCAPLHGPAALRHWRIELALGAGADGSARQSVAVLAQVASLGRLIRAHPPRRAGATGGFEGRLRLVLASARAEEELLDGLSRIRGARGFALWAIDSDDGPAVPPAEATRWIRVTAEQLDLLHEELLELRLEQRRLEAKLAARSRPVRRHLERSEMLLRRAQRTLIELRLVPFASVQQRLTHTVCYLATELAKQVDLELEGGDVRLDRAMLEVLVDPLIHLVRNALDHGLETPAERRLAGKTARGRLRVRLLRRGDRIQLSVEDDGRGICPERVKDTAVRLGLLGRDAADRLSARDTLLLTTLPGFSTARHVSHISGRGVGLDVVQDSLAQIDGRLEIHSTPGRGTELRMSVPLSIAVIRTLLLRCAGQIYAVPIEAVLRTGTIQACGGQLPQQVDTVCGPLPLLRLDRCLGLSSAAGAVPETSWTVLLCGLAARIVLAVDAVLGREDVVVKPLRPPLTRLRNYSGAALLADGTIALVLDPAELAAPIGAAG